MDERIMDDQHDLINPNRPRLRYIDHHIRPNCFKLSKRYTLAILIHIGFLIIFAMRSNICFFNIDILEKFYPNDTVIGKAFEIQGTMDAYFSLGYLLVQIPAGVIAYKYPPQRFFGICILASSIIAIIESFTLNWVTFEFGYAALLQGLVQSATIPAVLGILFKWAPPTERATIVAISYSGTFMGVLFGVIFSNWVCGYFKEEHLLAMYGIAGIIWYCAWIWLVFEQPADHPTISDSEFEYLDRHIHVPKIKPPIQWKKIFSSLPCWSLFVVYLCRSFNSFYLFQADYMQFNYVRGSGFVYELPALMMVFFVPASGFLADQIISRTSISTTSLRKYYICGGLFLEILAYIPGLFLDHNSWPYLVDTQIFDIICFSFTISAYFVNHLDIAPMFACVTMGISNIVGSLIDILVIDGSARKPMGNKVFFCVMSVIHIFGIVFYGIWGTGEIQPWAKVDEDEENNGNSTQRSTTHRHNGIENPL